MITYINSQKLHHHWYTLQSVLTTSAPERIPILFKKCGMLKGQKSQHNSELRLDFIAQPVRNH